ncbi:hypothetical protein AB0I22_19525 [Streptomyces sp. NPDC050610]|uniref:hypothetical protein n=1 Tax=Streptomyces sp. NPDC050610 TaxID=3157097 RepID=UPI00341516F4
MLTNACAAYPQQPASPAGEPTPQTCLQVARQAAIVAAAAADDAMTAAARCRPGVAARLESAMHAAHKEAVEAERHADLAEQYADDPDMPNNSLLHCARQAVNHAVRAQSAAGIEATAADLRAELELTLTSAEHAEQESARRQEVAQGEAGGRCRRDRAGPDRSPSTLALGRAACLAEKSGDRPLPRAV